MFSSYKPIGAAPRGMFLWGGRVRLGKKVCNAPQAADFREERNPPQADSIVSNNKLCTIQYCNITIPYCDIPYCRIRRDAPPITATPSSLPKRRRRIPTIVPSYRPVLRRHQLIVESSGPLVVIVSCVPYNIAILPYHIVILYHIM